MPVFWCSDMLVFAKLKSGFPEMISDEKLHVFVQHR
nr:MAG TPA: hypothetical protein [Caudoviricetes sp.]